MATNKSYTAQIGDTFEKIAEAIFGNKKAARPLAQYNKMNEVDAIAGATPIKIPDRIHVIKETKSENGTPVAVVDVLMPNLEEVDFYILRDGNVVLVCGPGDLVDNDYPHFEPVLDKNGNQVIAKGKPLQKRTKGAKVRFKEKGETNTANDFLLGIAVNYEGTKGIGNSIGKNLYELLVKDLRPVNLSERQRRIWASIWKSEGGLSAINSYDSAFFSFGPVQKTMGTANNKGELPATLAYIKEKDSNTYSNTLGKNGLEPIEIANDTGFCQIDGKPIKTATDKEEYRTFKWAYRFIKAMDNTGFATHFLDHNLQRVHTIENLTFTKNGFVYKFSDIYKSELSHALLLDAHINRPVLVIGNSTKKNDPIWIKAIEQVDSVHEKVLQNKFDDISLYEEIELIKHIINFRYTGKMSDAKLRAAYILMCVKGIQENETIIKQLGFVDKNALFNDAKIKNTVTKYFYNFLELNRG
jgi:hypothetical protein